MPDSFILIEGHKTFESVMAFALFELDRDLFPTPWSLDSWENLFLKQDRLLVLIKKKDKIAGFCLFDKNAIDAFAHLLKIVIHPDYRGIGLSKLLLNTAITHLEKNGFSQFFLEVEESNEAAQRLYLGAGFKAIHRKKDFYGEKRAAIIMTRNAEN